MENREIAIIFSRIADILEIKDENVFRIRAYRTAAENISGLSRQIKDMYKDDPALLEEIPGIGKDLREKIIEMIETSKLKYHEELTKEFSSGFVDMLNLSGLGPKKLKKLRDALNIKNVNDLEKACKQGKLADLEGMGEKTQEKLLQAIKHFRESEGRILLPSADYFSVKITEYLLKSKLFEKIETAGSFRRGTETVGDIDVLAISHNAEEAMDYFVNYPEAREIIVKGPVKSSIALKEGPQVDLRIVEAESYGAALVYFTGSKEHNIKIRSLAKSKGYKVNEYGVFSISSSGKEKMVAGKTEEDVYKSLGMQWIPPELRENQGEVEAALAWKLPKNLLKTSDIQGDLHVHTIATDGHNSLEEMARSAESKGYKYIAITEHSKAVTVANGLDERKLLAYVGEIRKFAKKITGIKILAGVEVDILKNGKLDLEDYALKEMDIVIAAAHSHFGLDTEKQTSRMLKAMDNKYVNVLAHPSGRLITSRASIQADFDKIFINARERDIYLEVNTHGQRIDLNSASQRRAKELGAKFVINTDAHSTDQFDSIVYGVVTARRAWVEKQDVLNTYGFDRLMKMLKKE